MKTILLVTVIFFFGVAAKADTVVNFTASSGSDTWTFSLPYQPIPTTFYTDGFGNIDGFGLPGSGSFDAGPSAPYTFMFTDAGGPGGVGYLSFQCQPFTACGWDLIQGFEFTGATLFTGSPISPTFLTGTFTSTTTYCPGILNCPVPTLTISGPFETPEPGTTWMLVMGLLLLGLRGRKLRC